MGDCKLKEQNPHEATGPANAERPEVSFVLRRTTTDSRFSERLFSPMPTYPFPLAVIIVPSPMRSDPLVLARRSGSSWVLGAVGWLRRTGWSVGRSGHFFSSFGITENRYRKLTSCTDSGNNLTSGLPEVRSTLRSRRSSFLAGFLQARDLAGIPAPEASSVARPKSSGHCSGEALRKRSI